MAKYLSFFLIVVSSVALAGGNESSFTPTSILTPIMRITLVNSSSRNNSEIYECSAGTESGCLVDVADNAALAALVSTITVDEGEYDQIQVGTCNDSGYSSQVKGTVVLGGTTYYTALNSNATPHDVLSTTAGNLDYVTVDFTGCAATYNLPSTLTVTADSSVNISLLLSTTNIAWARLGTATVPSGCAESADNARSACIAYPDVAPVLGTASPTLEAYHVCEGAACAENTASGQILLLFDTVDNFLGGFTRRLLSQTSATPSVNYDTAFRVFSKIDSTHVSFANYGSSSTTSYVTFNNFTRADHQGTMINNQGGDASITYEAYRQ